jgi:hypothetical protein
LDAPERLSNYYLLAKVGDDPIYTIVGLDRNKGESSGENNRSDPSWPASLSRAATRIMYARANKWYVWIDTKLWRDPHQLPGYWVKEYSNNQIVKYGAPKELMRSCRVHSRRWFPLCGLTIENPFGEDVPADALFDASPESKVVRALGMRGASMWQVVSRKRDGTLDYSECLPFDVLEHNFHPDFIKTVEPSDPSLTYGSEFYSHPGIESLGGHTSNAEPSVSEQSEVSHAENIVLDDCPDEQSESGENKESGRPSGLQPEPDVDSGATLSEPETDLSDTDMAFKDSRVLTEADLSVTVDHGNDTLPLQETTGGQVATVAPPVESGEDQADDCSAASSKRQRVFLDIDDFLPEDRSKRLCLGPLDLAGWLADKICYLSQTWYVVYSKDEKLLFCKHYGTKEMRKCGVTKALLERCKKLKGYFLPVRENSNYEPPDEEAFKLPIENMMRWGDRLDSIIVGRSSRKSASGFVTFYEEILDRKWIADNITVHDSDLFETIKGSKYRWFQTEVGSVGETPESDAASYYTRFRTRFPQGALPLCMPCATANVMYHYDVDDNSRAGKIICLYKTERKKSPLGNSWMWLSCAFQKAYGDRFLLRRWRGIDFPSDGQDPLIAELTGQDGQANHAVGIWRGMLFDPNVPFALRLCKETLSLSCGAEFHGIKRAFQVTRPPPPRGI